MNKFDRVFSTLILLQTKTLLTAKSISDRFDISLRTVYRDINTLKNAGVPIIGDPGIGYSILDGYRLPPVMFSKEELAALLTAEKFIGKMTDQMTQDYYSNALIKIKAILRSSEKQSLEVLDDSIAISNDKNWDKKTHLQEVFQSISSKQILDIKYIKADGSASQRRIESIGCYHTYNNWYLVAFCQSKQDYRQFKLSRIEELKVLDERFETKHISLQTYIDQQDDSWKEEQRFNNIEIAFNNDFVKFAERRKFYFGFVEQEVKGDAVHMKFLNSSLEVIARWLLQFADQATVIEPIQLKERLKTLSTEIYRHYNS